MCVQAIKKMEGERNELRQKRKGREENGGREEGQVIWANGVRQMLDLCLECEPTSI